MMFHFVFCSFFNSKYHNTSMQLVFKTLITLRFTRLFISMLIHNTECFKEYIKSCGALRLPATTHENTSRIKVLKILIAICPFVSRHVDCNFTFCYRTCSVTCFNNCLYGFLSLSYRIRNVKKFKNFRVM